jgi:hypothetical protein
MRPAFEAATKMCDCLSIALLRLPVMGYGCSPTMKIRRRGDILYGF